MEKVNERLRKTVTILENANVPYAVVGGHAVRAWVAQVDEAAVRTTRDVDILIRPHDLPHRTKSSLGQIDARKWTYEAFMAENATLASGW